VIEVAAHVPDELRAFALDQLRLAISQHVGGYHLCRSVDRKGITRQDVDYAMRILRGICDGGDINVQPQTWGVLMRIGEETLPTANHPRWANILAALRLVEYAEPARRSRWLRIVDDSLGGETAVA
jgi:lipoprotein-anchoring transpeptidase ErfK/SrfK